MMKWYAVKDKSEHIMMFVYENPNWISRVDAELRFGLIAIT